MESIPAAALPIVVAPDVQSSRDGTTGNAGDFGTFGQALEKEISVITAETSEAPADIAAVVLASAEVVARSDGTQILDVILDSTGMLASGAAAAAAAATQRSDVLEPRTDVRIAVEAASQAAPEAARTPRVVGFTPDSVRLEVAGDRGGRPAAVTDASSAKSAGTSAAIDMLADAPETAVQAEEQRSPVSSLPAQAERVAPALAAAVASSDKVLEAMRAMASAGRGPAPEMLASLDKTVAPANTPQRPGFQASSPGSVREEPTVRSLSDDLLPARIELRSERTAVEAPGLSAATAPVPAADSAPQPRDITMSLDSLSSATLMHRSTGAAHHATATSAMPAAVRVDTPLGAPGWNEAFRHQVVWLVDRQLETAELHVNPPNLGPVEVVLKVSDDGARIAFCSPHAAVREAIEASLSELRSGLAERGLALGEALVSADPGTAREQMMRDENVRGAPRISDAAPSGAEGETQVLPLRRGLIDTFV